MFKLFDLNFNLNVTLEEKKRGYICILKDYAIYKDNIPIDTKLTLKNHSSSGLSWGYKGSGCSQAALAILCDFTKDEKFSLSNYIEFKNDIISSMPEKDCLLKFSDIQKWVDIKKLTNSNL